MKRMTRFFWLARTTCVAEYTYPIDFSHMAIRKQFIQFLEMQLFQGVQISTGPINGYLMTYLDSKSLEVNSIFGILSGCNAFLSDRVSKIYLILSTSWSPVFLDTETKFL